MDPLLQHVITITGHRDHSLMAVAVVNALYTLTGATRVRLLDFVSTQHEWRLKQSAWIQDSAVVVADEKTEWEQPQEDIRRFTGLGDGISQRRSVIEFRSNDNGEHILWLPIWLNDKPVSCIEISSRLPLSRQTCSIAEGILNVYRNFQNLLDYSERDSLTGLFNRKTFDGKFMKMAAQVHAAETGQYGNKTERRQAQAAKEQWLAVVDIDHFKRVNDEFGHLYGDEVLILIANLLRTSFRPYDRIFRFGGEEFVIMLRAVTLENAHRVLERFRQKVEAYSFPQIGQVTISLGFVRISDNTPVVILGRADQALYYAKENGRNQVCFYDELVAKGMLQAENSASSIELF